MNSNAGWELKIRSKVLREVTRFPKKDVLRINEAIKLLPDDPFVGDFQKMAGEKNVWRRRIGSYRIFFELRFEERVVYVYHVERRTSKTY